MTNLKHFNLIFLLQSLWSGITNPTIIEGINIWLFDFIDTLLLQLQKNTLSNPLVLFFSQGTSVQYQMKWTNFYWREALSFLEVSGHHIQKKMLPTFPDPNQHVNYHLLGAVLARKLYLNGHSTAQWKDVFHTGILGAGQRKTYSAMKDLAEHSVV